MVEARRRRDRALRIIVAFALVLLWSLGWVDPAAGDDAIQVTSNSHQVRFAEGITFQLGVKTPDHIQSVALYYRRDGEGVTVRVPLEILVDAQPIEYTWELEPGDLPVGEHVEYLWRIMDDQGNELETPPQVAEYADDRFDWQETLGGSVVLLWYGADEDEAQRLLGYATQSLARLQDEMGVHLNQPVHVYVYRSKSDMSMALPRRSDAFDDRILTLGVVVDDATLLLLGSHADVEGTVAHELSHIVVGLATENPYVSLPRWLDEGLAMYSEGELPGGNQRALDSAIQRDQLISVRSLSAYTGDPAEVDLFYGEVYSLVDFLLVTYGTDAMSDLLDSFTEGITQEEALQRAYAIGVAELDTEWRRSLGLAPRSTLEPGTPPPREAQRRPGIACPGSALLGVLGLAATAFGRMRAGAS